METSYKVIQMDDLGAVIARADFDNQTIELNAKIFPNLPPMAQELVMCHEVCHLKYNDHEEAATNARAIQLFMQRSTNAADREKRKKFLETTMTTE